MKQREQAGVGLKGVIDGWNNQGYRIEEYGQNPAVVLLGEYHQALSHIRKQFELIDILRPDYVLYEAIGAWVYDPKTDLFTPQEERLFARETYDEHPEARNLSGVQWWKQFARDKHFELIGCDATIAECRKRAQELGIKLSDDSLMENENIIPLREKRMVQTVIDYRPQSSKPIVAVVGAVHSNNIHQRKLLRIKDVPYLHVDQAAMFGNKVWTIEEY